MIVILQYCCIVCGFLLVSLASAHMESSPYGAVYLSPPPDNNWRRWVVTLLCCWKSASSFFLIPPTTRLYSRTCFLLPARFLCKVSLYDSFSHLDQTHRCNYTMSRAAVKRGDGKIRWPSLFLQKCFKYRDATLASGTLHLTKGVWQIAFWFKGHAWQQ